MQTNMQTASAEATKIISDLFEGRPEEVLTIDDIKTELSRKATQSMSKGVLSGVMYKLTKNKMSGIFNINRGQYVYKPNAESDLTLEIYAAVDHSLKILKNFVDSVNPLELEEEDIRILKGLKKLITESEALKEDLTETYDIR